MAEVPAVDLANALKSRLPMYTVDRLKGIIQGFNEHCGAAISRSGKKSDLQEKLKFQLDSWAGRGVTVSIIHAKKIFDHVDVHGSYNGSIIVQSLHSPTTGVSRPTAASGSMASGSTPAGPSGARVPPPAATQSASGIHFKESPFFEIDQHVSGIVSCPESAHMQDRKSVFLDFSLTNVQREKLYSQGSNFQLRIYCTSSAFYTAPTAFRPNPATNYQCLIEFPATCELRVNGMNLHAQTKGLKKKPGTAPPANLGANVRTAVGALNKIEMTYCNSNPVQGQPPPNNRKYFLQVNLVKATAVDELVNRLKKGKYKPKDEILQTMRRLAGNQDDDDIVAGPQKMTLKCPLSYVRIDNPARSSKCPHPQCFDATSWYSMMEITTTWMCPICEKSVTQEDMMVDGYFDDILKSTDEDVEDVMVEADGEWHTTDEKYHSVGWIPTKPLVGKAKSGPPGSSSSSTVARSSISLPSPSDTVKAETPASGAFVLPPRKAEEIVLFSDDEDDDEAQVSRSIPGNSRKDDVIDLTLDSDDDEEQPLAHSTSRNANGKRKERTPPFVAGLKRARTGLQESIWGDDDGNRGFLPSGIPSSTNFNAFRGGSSGGSSAITSSSTGPQHPSTFRMHPFPSGSTSPPVPLSRTTSYRPHETIHLPPIRLPAAPAPVPPARAGFGSPPSGWSPHPSSPDRRYDYRAFP